MATESPGDAPVPRPAARATFTRAGVVRGAKVATELLLGMVPFGLVVGILANSRGLSLAELGLMSGLVFAGASQLLALELWREPVPLLAVGAAALVVNLRLLPMGAALAPWLAGLRGWRVWGNLGMMVDHTYALAVVEERRGGRDAGYLFGIGIVTWAGWLAATLAGHLLTSTLNLPPGHPLFFAAVATFLALLASLWRGVRRDVLPWALAGAVSLLVHGLGLPAPLPLLFGAASGATLGAWRATRRPR
ncbi:AzlC family ABC transporter permease [Roseomonas sp. OT10]|uniref:AzlC family ABC transporter permease n=1 Tax=Roseomonas cutis TaxID=2897332 RepID=UPI001E29A65E|nr:AzlC family ABC transporter permease [Roseomonas sp. OT10]UFN47012.1 AzlC family ABC transporter permease [Roseomonas sp. OT10]